MPFALFLKLRPKKYKYKAVMISPVIVSSGEKLTHTKEGAFTALDLSP